MRRKKKKEFPVTCRTPNAEPSQRTESRTAPEGSRLCRDEPRTPDPRAPDDTPPEPVCVKGALFRALVDAGADPLVAYTADEQAESMVSESVAVQVQPILADIRHQFAERDRKLDALTEAGAEYDRKLDALAEAGAERDRKLDALAEAGAERDRKLDALAEAGAERDRKWTPWPRPAPRYAIGSWTPWPRPAPSVRSEAGRNRRGDPWAEGSDRRQSGRAGQGNAADLGRPGCPAHGAYRGLRLPIRRLNPVRRLQSLHR